MKKEKEMFSKLSKAINKNITQKLQTASQQMGNAVLNSFRKKQDDNLDEDEIDSISVAPQVEFGVEQGIDFNKGQTEHEV